MASPAKTPRDKKSGSQTATNKKLDKLIEEAEFVDRASAEDRIVKKRQPGRLDTAPELKIGTRIQETRESLRMTQGELADLTKSLDSDEKGISRAVISLYEAGTNRPSPREIRLLCEALQVTPNYLIYGDERPFDATSNYARLGTISRRSDPEGYAWVAYVMSVIHHNHYDAVMKLVLDLARGWNKEFDQGLQEKANAEFLRLADELKSRLAERARLTKDFKK